jgi:hypothetical protein
MWAAAGAVFLAVELTGDMPGTPWRTLSETTWDLEREHPMLAPAVAGALLGLSVHLRSRVRFFHAEAGGIAIAIIAKEAWGF